MFNLAMDRYDLLTPLLDGRAHHPDLELNLSFEDASRHDRMLHENAFDAVEMSISGYFLACERGFDLIAVPYFPRRMFCHSFFFVHADSGITSPSQLKGKRVGLRRYQNSLALWARGYIQEFFGISPADIDWVTAYPEMIEGQLPAGISLTHRPEDPSQLLLNGEIDAIISPNQPLAFLQGNKQIRRLFPDYREAARQYYNQTGDFTIMHTIAFRGDVVRSSPHLPRLLTNVLNHAKKIALADLATPPRCSLIWAPHVWQEQQQLLGPDPWPVGIQPNAASIQRMMDYSLQQGLLQKKLLLKDIFIDI